MSAKASKIRKLRDKALKASSKGKYESAAELFAQLEGLDDGDGAWPHKAGAAYRSAGDTSAAVAAWERAAEKYAAQGFLEKAVAMCKMMLRSAPDYEPANARLRDLKHRLGFGGSPSADKAAEIPEPPPVPGVAVELAEDEAPEGANAPLKDGIEAIALHEELEGEDIQLLDDDDMELIVEESGLQRVFVIPIPDAVEDAFSDMPGRSGERENTLSRTPLFSDLSAASLSLLVDRVELVELTEGQVLFREGDVGDALYVIADGAIELIVEGPPRVHVSRLESRAFFGELALVGDRPRSATAIATEPTELLKISRQVISTLVESEPSVLQVLLKFLRERLFENLVRESPLFSPYRGEDSESLAARFKFLEAGPGTVLVLEGRPSPGLFVLLSGSCEVVRRGVDDYQRIATVGPGDFVGEMSIMSGSNAVATVRTTTKVLAVELPAQTFREMIMMHPEVLMHVGEISEQRRARLAAIDAGEVDYDEGSINLL